MKHLGRRSKQALMKAERMKKAYKIGKAKEMETVSLTCTESIVLDNMQTRSNSTSISRIFLIYKFKAETPLICNLGSIKLLSSWYHKFVKFFFC